MGYKKYLLGVILLLIVSNAIVTWLWLEKDVKPSVPADKFNLLNPTRNSSKQEDLIVNFQPLRDYLNKKYDADPNISLYFEYLPTGSNIAINKDAEFYPASLVKVPIAMAVAKKIERGEWKWTNKLVLLPSDKSTAFGKLWKEPTNSTWTIEELMRLSLSESDNTAHFILLRNLEVHEVEEVYDHMGLKSFLKTEGNLSAKRYSVILRALYNASFLSEENSQKLLSYMTQSPFNEFIQSGLPGGITFSHKIGTETEHEVFLDSGIAYAQQRPYVLTVMVKTKDRERAKAIMKDISGKVYSYVSDYSGEAESTKQ